MTHIIVIISFFLDGLLSIYQGSVLGSPIIFKPMITIVSILLIYPLCHKDLRHYYFICGSLGLAYDILYTNTLMLNMFIFPLLGFIIHKAYRYFTFNFINTILINLFILTIYHVLTFFILCLMGYLNFSIDNLLYCFGSIILINTIILMLSYGIVKHLNEKVLRRSKYSL